MFKLISKLIAVNILVFIYVVSIYAINTLLSIDYAVVYSLSSGTIILYILLIEAYEFD